MFPACCFRQRTYMTQSLLVGFSMRLELILVASLNDLWLVSRVYIRSFSLFRGKGLLWSSLPVFDILDICSCVYVYVCVRACIGVGVVLGFNKSFFLYFYFLFFILFHCV